MSDTMLKEITENSVERIKAQPNSLAASADEVRICWLVGEVARLQKKIKDAENCLVCIAIAPSTEVCKNTLEILRDTGLKPDAHEDASDRDIQCGKAFND